MKTYHLRIFKNFPTSQLVKFTASLLPGSTIHKVAVKELRFRKKAGA